MDGVSQGYVRRTGRLIPSFVFRARLFGLEIEDDVRDGAAFERICVAYTRSVPTTYSMYKYVLYHNFYTHYNYVGPIRFNTHASMVNYWSSHVHVILVTHAQLVQPCVSN